MDVNNVDSFLYGKEEAEELKDTIILENVEETELNEKLLVNEESELSEYEETSSEESVDVIISKPEIKSNEDDLQNQNIKDNDGGIQAMEMKSAEPIDVPRQEDIINIKGVGLYNGTPITNLNLENMADKPWTQAGADITDYFNYGFDEETWLLYCQHQNTMRETVNELRRSNSIDTSMRSGDHRKRQMGNRTMNSNSGSPKLGIMKRYRDNERQEKDYQRGGWDNKRNTNHAGDRMEHGDRKDNDQCDGMDKDRNRNDRHRGRNENNNRYRGRNENNNRADQNGINDRVDHGTNNRTDQNRGNNNRTDQNRTNNRTDQNDERSYSNKGSRQKNNRYNRSQSNNTNNNQNNNQQRYRQKNNP